MFCDKCGKMISDASKYCSFCGNRLQIKKNDLQAKIELLLENNENMRLIMGYLHFLPDFICSDMLPEGIPKLYKKGSTYMVITGFDDMRGPVGVYKELDADEAVKKLISAVEFNLKYPEEQLFCYHPEYKSDYKKYRDMSELSKESIKDVPASDRDDSEKWELIFTYMDGDWKSEYKNYGYRNIFTGKIKIESFCMGPGGSSGTDIYDSIEELRSSLKRIKEYGSPYNYEECNGFSIDDNSISDTNEKSSIE